MCPKLNVCASRYCLDVDSVFIGSWWIGRRTTPMSSKREEILVDVRKITMPFCDGINFKAGIGSIVSFCLFCEVPSIARSFMLTVDVWQKSLLWALAYTIDLNFPYIVDSCATKENARRRWPASS